MAEAQPKDSLYPDQAPPPYITTQSGINNSDTVICFPEVIVNDANGTEPLVKNFSFDDKQIRQGFIRKVYSIILVQLLITAGVIAWFMNDYKLQATVENNMPVFFGVTLTVYFSTAFCVICFEGPRRRVPYNYIFLLLFTLSLAAMVGLITTSFEFQEVMIAGGITFAIVVALTIFAFQTKLDFTLLSGSLLCVLLVFTLFGFAMIFSPFPKLRLVYTAVGVLIMCVYLVYDTQLMIGGKHRYAISPEEYVFAALNIYLDIMYIFIRILRLMR
ncbi:protein lifeguard 2-like [Choristoneura fumiferana]|uniref:protein lifeguard 2-like n=1 Tax=Choristoneura fumiferana TaxID=7141 RepID=UPI003D15CCAA